MGTNLLAEDADDGVGAFLDKRTGLGGPLTMARPASRDAAR